jgi:hypothetical protein
MYNLFLKDNKISFTINTLLPAMVKLHNITLKHDVLDEIFELNTFEKNPKGEITKFTTQSTLELSLVLYNLLSTPIMVGTIILVIKTINLLRRC